GSGVATLGLPDSPGVPQAATQDTLIAPYNDPAAVEALFKEYPEEIAAVIVEPVAGNMGVVPPEPGFLESLRQLTREHGALLIFDEVITGFRVAYGGAQALYNIEPDLTCLGKVIGGGLPVGAYGGERELMELVAPLGPVYQAGTLSGNPLAMAAGVATLKELARPATYERLDRLARQLAQGLEEGAAQADVSLRVNRVGSMLTPFFTDQPIRDYATAKRADSQRYAQFFWGLIDRGVYPPPSPFESWFVSLAHTPEDIARTVEAAHQALRDAR
ncbi:MAG TPA: aminotransferase class III-fold pyridoxal phosphate-dependent enzyme, partial [Anaerolineae bacterium]|nr:aminotransferase class III-fold pyridoxal phosphate-dependent enzyme [Anaerolineae bacterium]